MSGSELRGLGLSQKMAEAILVLKPGLCRLEDQNGHALFREDLCHLTFVKRAVNTNK